MTGLEALAEAARLESARIYGQTQREQQYPAITMDETDAIIDQRRADMTGGTVVPFERRQAAG
jgi:hypothetical protein